MAEEFNIIIEHLRAIRADIGELQHSVRRLENEMRADRMISSGLLAHSNTQDETIAHLKSQMERVNSRLNIADGDPH